MPEELETVSSERLAPAPILIPVDQHCHYEESYTCLRRVGYLEDKRLDSQVEVFRFLECCLFIAYGLKY